MQNLLEPLQPDVALAELITRQQHLLPEVQRQLTQLTASHTSSQQELTRRLGEVTSSLQPEFGQLLHQVNASASALGVLRKRLELGQPDAALTGLGQQLNLLQKQMTDLSDSVAAQQQSQHRNHTLQLITLLVALAAFFIVVKQLF